KVIEVRDLVKVFDTRGQVVRAVDHVTTQVAKGEVLVVIGPSGSGKSTFLRCLNGLEEFDSGSVSIDGLQLADPKTDVNAYRREVLDVMKTLALEGMTMVCVTHEMGFAREVADRVLFFDHGKLLEDAAPAEFFNAPKDPRAQAFLRQVL